jgi:hypothetical protein
MNSRIVRGLALPLALSLSLAACSGHSDRTVSEPFTGGPGLGDGSDADGTAPANPLDEGSGSAPAAGSDGGPSGESATTCAKVTNKVDLLPVHLAFAFDVSGSMGKGDKPWHDQQLKWDPVVLATRTFFSAESSRGLFASLTFFPADGDEDERCEADAYQMPHVPRTALPSPAFGSALDDITPEDSDDWRGGTPTAFALAGTREYIVRESQRQPARYAIVLVTDGSPAGCDDDSDTIEAAVAETKTALAQGISTYVIGVKNPPIDDAPDTVANLTEIAKAGNTPMAYIIDTGDATKTADTFGAAIAKIREFSVSCTLAIPESRLATFDKRKVVVSYQSGARSTALSYDAACGKADTWHYDDETDPKQIVLCDDTCKTVQADREAQVQVEFACENLILL